MNEELLARVIAEIDRRNAEDPNHVVWGGEEVPKELLHATRATAWLLRRCPDATPAQRLAARGHHFLRWTRPRAAYPEGRAGYLRWRADAKVAQASELADLLVDNGVDGEVVDEVSALVSKSREADPERAAVHEDVLCLVFFEQQAVAVAEQLAPPTTERVVERTLRKMSPRGRELLHAVVAEGEIDVSDDLGRLIAAGDDAVDDV